MTGSPLVELTVDDVAVGGDGVGREASGRVVFCQGGLPGERVRVELTERRADWARGQVVEVLSPSPQRVAPPCAEVARGCGGCDWQHVAVEAQPELKRGAVEAALRRLGRIADPDVRVGPVLPADGHRTTVRVAVDADGRAAFRRRRSHELLTVEGCVVASPLIEDLLATTRFGRATEATLRVGARTGERLLLAEPSARRVEAPAGVVVVGADELARGSRADAAIHEVVAGTTFRISASSFFQARPDGAEAMVALVREAAGEVLERGGARIVDAYGGVGLFGATLGAGHRVELVERHRAATADARWNLARAGVDGRVVRVDVDRWRPSPADLVIADPARRGLGRQGVDVLSATGAERLVLVSCDAGSLGRDAGLLAAAGFRLAWSSVVDMFPHTSHVEVVSRFDRLAPPPPPAPAAPRGRSRGTRRGG